MTTIIFSRIYGNDVEHRVESPGFAYPSPGSGSAGLYILPSKSLGVAPRARAVCHDGTVTAP